MNTTLDQLRQKINAIDQQLLSLITDRAGLLHDILTAKVEQSGGQRIGVFDPKRERSIIDNLVAQNTSCLPDREIDHIFQSIMAACRNLQMNQIDHAAPFLVSIQGNAGSFSEEAFLLYCQQKSIDHYDVNYALSSHKVLKDILSGRTNYGIVAVNNAQGGLVKETIDALSQNRYRIVDSVVLRVHHSLLVKPGSTHDNIHAIYSHPQALAQCREYLAMHFPHCAQINWKDTASAAADLVTGNIPPDSAVIAHSRCANAGDLSILDTHIQDLGDDNETLFLLITGPKS